jgi:hypothetical protein
MTIIGVKEGAGIKVMTAVENVYSLGLDGRKLFTNMMKTIYNMPPRMIAPRRIHPKDKSLPPGCLFISFYVGRKKIAY